MSSEREPVATESMLRQREFPQIEEETRAEYEQRIDAILSQPDTPGTWAPSSYDCVSMTLVEDGIRDITEYMQASHTASRIGCMVRKFEQALCIALEAEGQGLRLRPVISSRALQEKLTPLREEAERAWRETETADQRLCQENYHAWRMVNK